LILFIWLRPAEKRMREVEKSPPDDPMDGKDAVLYE
jgi:hypothetical protein